MNEVLTIEGAYGEGGGQILRSALSLALVTGRHVRITNIRGSRAKTGLRPQHLSALRAAAAVSGAGVSGDQLGSTEISFAPAHAARHGDYAIDVAAATSGGSAGAVTLLLQTLLVPLALARGHSTLRLRGGTHVPWSPPFDSIESSYLPALQSMGLKAKAKLLRWGWYPAGQGEVACTIDGDNHPHPIEMTSPGMLNRIEGRAVVSNLPIEVAQRLAATASTLLAELHVPVHVRTEHVEAASPGAGLFLRARYEHTTACFSALGERGKPSETVAAEAVEALREHVASGAVAEVHLADQLLLPLALASGPSTFTTSRVSQHLTTNMWAIEQFAVADISVEPTVPTRVHVRPRRR